MRYEGMVYRPPSEARSLIIQVTIGCAHNRCRFCSMYKVKNFHIRPLEDILADLAECAAVYGSRFKKVFLADGDALVIPTNDMLTILQFIRDEMPWVEQISSYAAPKDLLRKTPEELKQIHDAGLDLLYMGCESGDDVVLKDIDKGVTHAELVEAAAKAHAANFRLSVTLISGLGGQPRLKEHAVESGRLISEIKPEYLGFLTLMLEEPAPIVAEVASGKFKLLEPEQVMEEMELFLENTDSEGTIFRSNHASNYVMLAGTLNQDREKLIEQTRWARKELAYRKEKYRRL